MAKGLLEPGPCALLCCRLSVVHCAHPDGRLSVAHVLQPGSPNLPDSRCPKAPKPIAKYTDNPSFVLVPQHSSFFEDPDPKTCRKWANNVRARQREAGKVAVFGVRNGAHMKGAARKA